jgi:AraC family cel operon transcriptional repressor
MKFVADGFNYRELGFHYRYSPSIKFYPEPHTHDFFELFITFDSQVEHIVNGTKKCLDDGLLIFIRPNDYHCFSKTDSSSTHLLNVAFRQDTFDAMCAFLEYPNYISQLLLEPLPPIIRLQKVEQQWIKSRFEELAFSTDQNKSMIKHQFKLQLIHLFVNFFNRHQLAHKNPTPIWLNQLKENMQKKDNFLIGLPKLIELSGKSHAHLNRTIKHFFGMNCTEWLNSFKAQHAANLLHYTDLDIIDIASESGFENISHFYKVFKHHFQSSPAKYRRIHSKDIL